jgi:transcriptional regulator
MMGRPKPTLCYPSRTAAVQALRKQGLTDMEIARRIGIRRETVAALECSAGRRKRPAEQNGRTVLFPLDVLEALRPHAEARGIAPDELARRLIEAAIDDNLIDAVLDDGKE